MSQKYDLKTVFLIFWTFFKISPLTFGGGYVMIPFLEKELVERRKWIKSEEIADLFAVSESVPGSIAVNSGTFIGYRLAGVPGAIAAMAGAVIPTFLIALTLAILFIKLRSNPFMESVFNGIRPTVIALILYAGFKIGQTALIDLTTTNIFILTVVVLVALQLHPIFIILSGAFLGMGLGWWKRSRQDRGKDVKDRST